MIDLNKNKSFCILPFIHLSVVGKRVKPCCRFSPENILVRKHSGENKNNISLNSIFYSTEYNELRNKMLRGEKVAGCSKCYKEEKVGGVSMRKGSFKPNKHMLSSDLSPKLKFIEIGFGNICNLRCRTCSSTLSNKWKEEDKILDKKYLRYHTEKHNNNIDLFFDNSLKDVEYIKVVGGEPMLSSDFSIFLDNLIKNNLNKKCAIELFTNASYRLDNKVLNKLINFRRLFIHLSIDAYKDKNSYIRNPSNWKEVEKSAINWLKISKNNSNVFIALALTISIYNVIYLHELVDWWLKNNKKYGKKENWIHFIYVFSPNYLSIINTPFKLRKIFIKKVQGYCLKYKCNERLSAGFKNLSTILDNNNEHNLDLFQSFTKDLDKLRNENFAKTFPELNKIIKYI